MKIFVGGGTGVIGKPSVEALVAAGYQVRSSARGAEKAALVRAMGAARSLSRSICTMRPHCGAPLPDAMRSFA